MQNEQPLERFGQTLINSARVLAVIHHQADGNVRAYSTLVFDTGQQVNISPDEGQALIESYPNKACKCSQMRW